MTANGFVRSDNIRNARSALRYQGYLVMESAYDDAACAQMIALMDAPQSGRIESNYSGSELRIWDAQKVAPPFTKFWDECNVFMSGVVGRDTDAFTLLAIRNRPVSTDDKSMTLGRWHIDSLRRQVKIFLFLTDTTVSSGPFEFLMGTHRPSFKMRMVANGNFLAPTDLFNGKRAYNSLDDAMVATLASEGYRQMPMICKGGTALIIDTSAIHRARPCMEGARYALTAYFR